MKLKYYGYKAIKNGKPIFLEWFWEEKLRDKTVETLTEAFHTKDETEKNSLLNAIRQHCQPIMEEDNLSFEKIETYDELYKFVNSIGDLYYSECKAKLMKDVARQVNAMVTEEHKRQIYVFNELENETIEKNKNIDCFSLSDIYITYLNEEYGYNFIRTIPMVYEWFDIDETYNNQMKGKYYVDMDKKVMLCFTRQSKLHYLFSLLHEDIVNRVIKFCKKHKLDAIDKFEINADGLQYSIPNGYWTASTDSSFSLINSENKQIMQSI